MLAAGSGRRYGRPKALVDTGSGPWVRRALSSMVHCAPLVVVVGAAAAEVAALLPHDVFVVDNPDHQAGMGSSLRVGLQAVGDLAPGPTGSARGDQITDHEMSGHGIDAVLVMLVDLPGVGPEVIRRVASAAGAAPAARQAIVRAAFAGQPGHPVLFGRHHWPGVIDAAVGDRGARDYLARHPAELIECGDIGSGEDVDSPV